MKTFKRIIPFLLALVMVLAIPLAGCRKKKKEDPPAEPTKTLQSISVNADSATTVFYVGDGFSAEGLEVKASFALSNSEEPEVVTLSAGDYRVDSSAYKKDVVGTYPIKVSYTYEGVTKDASYEVSVTTRKDGLEVKLADGIPGVYTLSATQTTVEIDVSKIVVKEINLDGTVGNTVSDYSAKLYRGQEEVALSDGKASVGSGVYTIWVEKASTANPGFMRSAFVLIYVNDNIESIELKSGKTTQTTGNDTISSTWVFTVTYASGATKEVKAKDCEIEIDTKTVAENAKAKVTYTDTNASGGVMTKTIEVSYTITASTSARTEIYNLDLSAINLSSGTALTQNDLEGENAFLQVGSGNATFKIDKEIPFIELAKAKSLQVTFDGTGKITIGFASTGGSNWSRVALKNSSGQYIAATYTPNDEVVKKDGEDNIYLVKGTTPTELTFEISESGTYSMICESNSDYNRACRIYSVSMEDTVGGGASATALSAVDFSNQTYMVEEKVERV